MNDLTLIIESLRKERDRFDRAIEVLEDLVHQHDTSSMAPVHPDGRLRHPRTPQTTREFAVLACKLAGGPLHADEIHRRMQALGYDGTKEVVWALLSEHSRGKRPTFRRCEKGVYDLA